MYVGCLPANHKVFLIQYLWTSSVSGDFVVYLTGFLIIVIWRSHLPSLCWPLPVVYSHSSHLWARGLCRAVGVPAASSASSTRGAGSRASRTSGESSTSSHLLSYQRLRRRPERRKHNKCFWKLLYKRLNQKYLKDSVEICNAVGGRENFPLGKDLKNLLSCFSGFNGRWSQLMRRFYLCLILPCN